MRTLFLQFYPLLFKRFTISLTCLTKHTAEKVFILDRYPLVLAKTSHHVHPCDADVALNIPGMEGSCKPKKKFKLWLGEI